MQPRQIGITLVPVLAAFGVAFAIGKAAGGGGGGETASAADGTSRIDIPTAAISATVSTSGGLPALKSEPRRPSNNNNNNDNDNDNKQVFICIAAKCNS